MFGLGLQVYNVEAFSVVSRVVCMPDAIDAVLHEDLEGDTPCLGPLPQWECMQKQCSQSAHQLCVKGCSVLRQVVYERRGASLL